MYLRTFRDDQVKVVVFQPDPSMYPGNYSFVDTRTPQDFRDVREFLEAARKLAPARKYKPASWVVRSDEPDPTVLCPPRWH